MWQIYDNPPIPEMAFSTPSNQLVNEFWENVKAKLPPVFYPKMVSDLWVLSSFSFSVTCEPPGLTTARSNNMIINNKTFLFMIRKL